MSEASKSWAEDWLAGQQAMLKAFFPACRHRPLARDPARGHPLEEQFAELRDTWQASIAKWTDFAKEAAQGEMPSADKLREMFAPAAWSGPAAPA